MRHQRLRHQRKKTGTQSLRGENGDGLSSAGCQAKPEYRVSSRAGAQTVPTIPSTIWHLFLKQQIQRRKRERWKHHKAREIDSPEERKDERERRKKETGRSRDWSECRPKGGYRTRKKGEAGERNRRPEEGDQAVGGVTSGNKEKEGKPLTSNAAIH